MELEELPYQVTYRPGKDNLLPDLLSRTPDLQVNPHVNNEENFENKVYYAQGVNEWITRIWEFSNFASSPAYGSEENSILEVRTLNCWISKIKREQRKDATILNTREQLSKHWVV